MAPAGEKKQPKRKRKAAKKDTRSDDLTMRLMACHNCNEEECMQLEMDCVNYVKESLASGRKKQAVGFLNENKHRFTPEMKDSLTDVISKEL
jgi:hypothetical protein